MILGDHAGHLVPQACGLLWQQIGVQVPDCPARHVVWGGRLCSCMFKQPCNRGESPLMVLEGEGELGSQLMPPRLGAGVFGQPAPLERLFIPCLHLFGP